MTLTTLFTVAPLAVDQVVGLLEKDPSKRISAKQAMEHVWMVNVVPLSRLSFWKRFLELVPCARKNSLCLK